MRVILSPTLLPASNPVSTHFPQSKIGLYIPKQDGGIWWWAAVYGVTQSWTQLKQFSSSSSSSILTKTEMLLVLHLLPYTAFSFGD